LSNIEISEKLCLSPKTVSTYRSRLLEKLDAHNEVDLIRIAVEQGMVEFTQARQASVTLPDSSATVNE